MRSVLSEPLLHFLLLGAALFTAYGLLNRCPEVQPDEILVSAGQIDHLAATFARFQQRPATAQELKDLIDKYVQEEILSREAVKLGLDQDDAIIRRRLQQKMEFVAADLALANEPNELELAAWLAEHSDRFREPPQFSFRHVYFSPKRRGDRFDADVSKLLADLKQTGTQAETTTLGDSFLLPHEFVDQSQTSVAAQFGPEFVRELERLNTGEWTGPIRSGFGVHLVLLTARSESRLPSLDQVREMVKRDLTRERHLEAKRRFLDELLAKYQVKVEWPKAAFVRANTTAARVP